MWLVDNFRVVILVVGLCVNLDSVHGQLTKVKCYKSMTETEECADGEVSAGFKYCTIDPTNATPKGCAKECAAYATDDDAKNGAGKVTCDAKICCCNANTDNAGVENCNNMGDSTIKKEACGLDQLKDKVPGCKDPPPAGASCFKDLTTKEACTDPAHTLCKITETGAPAGCMAPASPAADGCAADSKDVKCHAGTKTCCCANKAGNGADDCNNMGDTTIKDAACAHGVITDTSVCPAATTDGGSEPPPSDGGGANGLSTSFTMVIGTMVTMGALCRRASV